MRQRRAAVSGGSSSSLPPPSPPPPPAASDRVFPAGGSATGGARPCPSMAFPGALGKSRDRRQRRAGVARGGSGDLGRRPGGDGPWAAVSGAPAAGAPAGRAPRLALPHLLAAAGCGSPRCQLTIRGGLEAAAAVVVIFMACAHYIFKPIKFPVNNCSLNNHSIIFYGACFKRNSFLFFHKDAELKSNQSSLSVREVFGKRAFTGCWMAFIPPPHPIKMSSYRSPSRSPWVKDSTSAEGYWIQDLHPFSSLGWHSLHEYCMKCLTTILGLLNSFQ